MEQLNEFAKKVTIGIISYFPDDMMLKRVRAYRLNELIAQCSAIFRGVDITIIAQNWKGVSLQENPGFSKIIIHNFKDGLGINGARKMLRKKFIESDYEWLIMLDDDGVLRGTSKGGQEYLENMANHPGGFCEFRPSLLKLFAISKPCFELIDYPDGGADDKDPRMRLFEDMWLIRSLKRVYPERRFTHKMSMELIELSDSAYDEGNTGWHRVYNEDFLDRKWDRHDTGGNTRYMIAQAKPETLLHPELIKRRDLNDPKLMKWNEIDSVEKYGMF